MTLPLSPTQLFERLKKTEMNQVMDELIHFRRQTERLDLMNKLHARMASVSGLDGMIEAYSVWLMPMVKHELIAYNNFARRKKHMFCSGHGPVRRNVMAFAESLLCKDDRETFSYKSEDGHYAHKWMIESSGESGLLLVIKEDHELTEAEIGVINESLVVFGESVRRGLEYEELLDSAHRDALTGLSNRRVFSDRVNALMESSKRYGHPLTIASLDLDYFKQLNDKLGHQRGDRALKQIAAVFKENVRATDLAIRMGGDEFLIVMENTSQASGRVLAERICKAVDDLNVWADEETKLGISIGLAQWRHEENLAKWLDRVDDYLYHSKIEGRARVTSGD
ncbi:MAG: GGDEF domain-containing protein [Thermodesulfobacteriota bacterium]